MTQTVMHDADGAATDSPDEAVMSETVIEDEEYTINLPRPEGAPAPE